MTLSQHRMLNIGRRSREACASLQDYFMLPPLGIKEGVVENINPALERVFRGISDREAGHQNLILNLQGMSPLWKDNLDLEGWLEEFGADLPNVIESLRAKYAAKSGERVFRGAMDGKRAHS